MLPVEVAAHGSGQRPRVLPQGANRGRRCGVAAAQEGGGGLDTAGRKGQGGRGDGDGREGQEGDGHHR